MLEKKRNERKRGVRVWVGCGVVRRVGAWPWESAVGKSSINRYFTFLPQTTLFEYNMGGVLQPNSIARVTRFVA